MRLSIATSTVACIAAATTNIKSASAQDDIINHLKEKAMTSGNAKLLDHLNDFTQLREDATRRLVEDLAAAASNDSNKRERAMKGSKKDKKCFHGYATEAFKHYSKEGDSSPNWNPGYLTHTKTEGYDADIYWWGTNAVCDDGEKGKSESITWVPTTPFSDEDGGYSSGSQINEPRYCAEYLSSDFDNAPLIGSGTGHCFLSPVRIVSRPGEEGGDYGGDTTDCDQTGPCEWSCQEVMIIKNDGRDDYLFLQYIFKPATEVEEDLFDDVWMGDFPDLFDVVVTGGTGCYEIDGIHIIPGYSAYGVAYFVYDLSPLKEKRKSAFSRD
jgi:hypothetical protein